VSGLAPSTAASSLVGRRRVRRQRPDLARCLPLPVLRSVETAMPGQCSPPNAWLSWWGA